MIRLLFAGLLAVAAPAFAAETHEHEGEDHHAFALGKLVVEHAWLRATNGKTADIFMELHNLGDQPILLQGAQTDLASSANLVGFVLKNGEETAQEIAEVPVPAQREMELAPGIMAIRLSGLTQPLEQGEHLELTLLTGTGPLDIEAEIGTKDATHHSHAGHSHLGELPQE